jgi:RNA polymerase sigma factor (sigma-70 family)
MDVLTATEEIRNFCTGGIHQSYLLYASSILVMMKRPEIFSRVDDIDSINEPEADPDNEDYAGLEAYDLLFIIRELPPKYRIVFNLYAIEGYSHKEIGKMLSISEGTSKSNLSRARFILQRRVGSYTGIKKKVANG